MAARPLGRQVRLGCGRRRRAVAVEVQREVVIGDVLRRSDRDHVAALEQERAMAEAVDRAHVVRDEHDRLALVAQALKTSKHFCWKAASPTASTSSISRMSASTWIATEKARRTCMPDE